MTWSPAVVELLAMHETFRKLGFLSEELFVAAYDGGRVQFQLHRGGDIFSVDIPDLMDAEVLNEEWGRAVDWWNTPPADNPEFQVVWESSRLLAQGTVTLVAALVTRGFYPLKQPCRTPRSKKDLR